MQTTKEQREALLFRKDWLTYTDRTAILADLERAERMELALRKIAKAQRIPDLYHGGETYAGLAARIQGIAQAALGESTQ